MSSRKLFASGDNANYQLSVVSISATAKFSSGMTGKHCMKNIPQRQIVVTVLALVSWLMLYAVGLLLESVEHRIVLAPVNMKKQLGDAGKDLYNKVMKVPQTEVAGKDSTLASSAAKPAADLATKGPPVILPQHSPTLPEPGPSVAWAFFVAFFCYSPTNMAMLTLVAGFLGGCVSNAVVTTMEEDELKRVPERQLAFMCENPLAATMRGFVIYLCLVAGLYAAMDDPFKDSTPAQYARLAGSLSLVAFVVGYDPTRIEGWLRMAPGPQPSK